MKTNFLPRIPAPGRRPSARRAASPLLRGLGFAASILVLLPMATGDPQIGILPDGLPVGSQCGSVAQTVTSICVDASAAAGLNCQKKHMGTTWRMDCYAFSGAKATATRAATGSSGEARVTGDLTCSPNPERPTYQQLCPVATRVEGWDDCSWMPPSSGCTAHAIMRIPGLHADGPLSGPICFAYSLTASAQATATANLGGIPIGAATDSDSDAFREGRCEWP